MKIKECLQRVQRGIESISLIIDEVSIIGKAEAQKLRFEPQPVKVNEFCQLLLEDLQLINHHEGQITINSQVGVRDRNYNFPAAIFYLIWVDCFETKSPKIILR